MTKIYLVHSANIKPFFEYILKRSQEKKCYCDVNLLFIENTQEKRSHNLGEITGKQQQKPEKTMTSDRTSEYTLYIQKTK